MDKRIRELYGEDILDQALACYGVDRDAARLLDGFESFVYEVRKDGERSMLRLAHDLHRTSDMIQGEIEWLNYLVGGGVPAARALLSERGNLVEPIEARDGSHFTAVSFEWAEGHPPTREEWTNGLPVQIGQIMGRMHALTRHFQPSQPRFRRPQWHEDYEGNEGYAERYLPPSEATVIARFHRLLEHLHSLPREEDSYGLIHVDVHGGNFFVHKGRITLFDFDDCQYAWFAYDVAMALFYAISHDCTGKEELAWARRFLTEFIEGYQRENTFGRAWLKLVPYFLKLREIDLYIVIHRSLDLDDLDPWCASFMKDRRHKIEHEVPYVEMDWGAFAP